MRDFVPIKMPRFLLGLFLCWLCPLVAAQESIKPVEPAPPSNSIPPGLRDKAIVLGIGAEVLDSKKDVVWNGSDSRITIPGKAVNIRLFASNVVVLVQFTPYFSDDNTGFLVAQAQIWAETPDEGMHYLTTVQSIPIKMGEEVCFLPLGANKKGGDSIAITVAVNSFKGQKVKKDDKKPQTLPSTKGSDTPS
jgi:hypothetical protein